MRVRFSIASVLVLASACSGGFTAETSSTDAAVTGSGSNGNRTGASGASADGGRTGTGGRSGTGGRNGTGGLFSDASVPSGGGTVGDGGAPSDGGSPSTGGSLGTGGMVDTGGMSATGGTVSTGGTVGTGGSHPTGGSVGTGGTVGTGGNVGTGGTVGTGGITSTGGSTGTGGITSTGGSTGTGGTVGSGGVTGTGGAGTGGSPDCKTFCANQGLECCNGGCVNTANDPFRCGGCDNQCPSDQFFCSAGQCGTPPCLAVPPPTTSDAAAPVPNGPVPIACLATQTCCGTVCCDSGLICCEVTINLFTNYQCVDPSGGATCPTGCPTCVCASPDTPISTPDGDRAIGTLGVGDMVYSVDANRVVAVPITLVHRKRAQRHVVMHVVLSNGSVLDVSAPHPTADGRLFGDLKAGDTLSGVTVTSVTRVPYRFEYTYDILPASETGAYFAGGVLIGSTLGGSAMASGRFDDSLATMPR